MHLPQNPDYSKLMEDSLHSRVNGAREALLIAKLNFRRACQDRSLDRELRRKRQAVTAKAQARAMLDVLTAVRDLNAFIIDGSVPKDKSAQNIREDLFAAAQSPREVKRREYDRRGQIERVA